MMRFLAFFRARSGIGRLPRSRRTNQRFRPVVEELESRRVLSNTWTWTGAVSTAWEDPANWDSGSTIQEPPPSGAYVVIPAGTTNLCAVTAPTEDVSSVIIYGTLSVLQGNNAYLDAGTVTIGRAVGGGAGTLIITGAT